MEARLLEGKRIVIVELHIAGARLLRWNDAAGRRGEFAVA